MVSCQLIHRILLELSRSAKYFDFTMIIILWGKHHLKYWFLIGNPLQICMQKLLWTSRSRYAAHEKRGRNDSNVQITEGEVWWMKAVTAGQLLPSLCEMNGWSHSGLWETGILPTKFQTVWAQRPNPKRTQGTPVCLKMGEVHGNREWQKTCPVAAFLVASLRQLSPKQQLLSV